MSSILKEGVATPFALVVAVPSVLDGMCGAAQRASRSRQKRTLLPPMPVFGFGGFDVPSLALTV
ncbi:MAG TPA: hypothetical protein DDZ42_07790 [Candidatus Rokubacteria bacterium]|nr:MAG: hypothetical protein A2050_13730 [Candidatus Rokubacteria bacterium GWA2_73_35]HBH01808.1 hypothetical protein [Candidatus Rokubacteria bacterium]